MLVYLPTPARIATLTRMKAEELIRRRDPRQLTADFFDEIKRWQHEHSHD